ncbi:MAG: hypothetical protein HY576_08385 [candidate division NC10 bacterium]|nr:hypothetical protein [candidate division NC10 bacterium]
MDGQADLITLLGILQAREVARPHSETWMPRATRASLQALGLAVVRGDGGTRMAGGR